MATEADLKKITAEGKQAFESGEYEKAVSLFESSAEGYTSLNDPVNTAEMKNNKSVVLLKMGRAQDALDAVLGTREIFAGAGDLKREGMAVGNQAAALEALKRYDEAIGAYEESAGLFATAGEGDLRSMVLKSAAGIKLKRGQVTDSAFKMIGSLEAKEKPSVFERVLKFLLRFVQR